MRVTITLEARFDCTPDGACWTMAGFAYPFWTRYLAVFDAVRVVARARTVAEPVPGSKRLDGPEVAVAPVPYYHGFGDYLRRRRQVHRAVRRSLASPDAIIQRVPGPISGCVEPTLRKTGRPYALEVVGDPYDVFAPGAVKHPLRGFFRWYFSRQLARQALGASAAAYVTEGALQRRYPARPDAFSTHYSSVELSAEAFVSAARPAAPAPGRLRLVTIGSLEQPYKGTDILIESMALCLARGLDAELVVIGEGKYRSGLEAEAERRGLGDRVQFRGMLPAGRAVREELDRAALFVLPSRTDGLPRAMIEAMARALPCIGSTVGGIPELLPADDMVPPNSAVALADKIVEVLADPDRIERMSVRNLRKAKEFADDVLRERRNRFYRVLREQTEEWIRKHGCAGGGKRR